MPHPDYHAYWRAGGMWHARIIAYRCILPNRAFMVLFSSLYISQLRDPGGFVTPRQKSALRWTVGAIVIALVLGSVAGTMVAYNKDRAEKLNAFKADLITAGFFVDMNGKPVDVRIKYKDERKKQRDGSYKTESELDAGTMVAGCYVELERGYSFWSTTKNFKLDEVHANSVPDGIDVSEGINTFQNFTVNRPTRKQVYDWLVSNKEHFNCVKSDLGLAG